MALLEFVVPANLRDLERYEGGQYCVETVFQSKDISNALKSARKAFREDGCAFVLSNFDAYYSLIVAAKSTSRSTLFFGYEDIQRAMRDLPKLLQFVLDNNEGQLAEEVRDQHRNILKMLMYLYGKLVQALEDDTGEELGAKKSRKDKDESHKCNWTDVLRTINLIMQIDLNKFWDPPVVDELFINSTFEIVYNFLESPSMRYHKESLPEICSLSGVIINNYGVNSTFCGRLVRIAKASETASNLLAEVIIQLITKFNCNSLLKDMIHELIDWQMFDKGVNGIAQKNCQKVITDLAMEMPENIFAEMDFLGKYLNCNCINLRITVLSVIAEILLFCRRTTELKEEIQAAKLEFLKTMQMFTKDKIGTVRSKVFQLITTLQKENAIPIKHQNDFLAAAVFHLYDVLPAVRKSAASCVLTFLSCNIYGANIKLSEISKEFETKEAELKNLKIESLGLQSSELEEIDHNWMEHVGPLKNWISDYLTNNAEEGHESADTGEANGEKTTEPLTEVINKLRSIDLKKENYADVFMLTKRIVSETPSFQAMLIDAKPDEFVDLYLMFIRSFSMNLSDKIANIKMPSESELKALLAKEQHLEYLNNLVQFAKLMDESLTKMKLLLRSTNISDIQKPCEFILAANQFKLDGAQECIVDLLDMMKLNDPERRKSVMETLKVIVLSVDTTLFNDRELEVVKRLVDLLKVVPCNNFEDFKKVIAGWAESGDLDNNVIDMLWKMFIQSPDSVPEIKSIDQLHALMLLGMAAKTRPLIVERNYRVVAQICFKTVGEENILLAAEGCKMLELLATGADLTNKTAGFRIKKTDQIWKDLHDLAKHHFLSSNAEVNSLLASIISLAFLLHDAPITYLDSVVNELLDLIDSKELSTTMLVRYNVMVGELAICLLHFLDESVYKELKRRKIIRQEKKTNGRNKSVNDISKSSAMAKRKSMLKNNANNGVENNVDNSMMEGAEAYDEDSEYISSLLDDYLTGRQSSNMLCDLYVPIVDQCSNLSQYKNVDIQNTAVIALIRGMLLSTSFCQRYVKLVFKILAETDSIEIKKTIIIHVADLLEMSPNIIEPYISRVYEQLSSEHFEMRKVTLNILCMLILKDMIRPQEKIAGLAKCLTDENKELRTCVEHFFHSLAQKSNNLYNYLPDIFSNLIEITNEEQLQVIMKFLFDLIDKVKHLENLAERFSLKYKATDSEYVAKNLTFVLSLLNYNDRALKKLVQNFSCFQHFVLVPDVYSTFKAILIKSRKNKELIQTCDELENLMNNMFQSTGNAPPPDSHSISTRGTASKTKRGTQNKKKQRARRGRKFSSSSSEDEAEVSVAVRGNKKMLLSTKKSQKKNRQASNSD